jgi:hypothetical protein
MGVVCALVMQQYCLLGDLLLLAGQQDEMQPRLDMKAVAEFSAHSYAYFEQVLYSAGSLSFQLLSMSSSSSS